MFFKNKIGGADWMVVFLGNPGAKYEHSRHNIGFMTADVFEKREKIKICRAKFNALTALTEISGKKVLLMKPQTYMNLSGNSVAPACAFYKIAPEHIIVICDDISLPVGKLRIRSKGSAGGHNGLKSIISALGTEDFPRFKIGVGAPDREGSENAVIDWVLGSLSKKDAELVNSAISQAADAIVVYIAEGADKAMNMFN